MGPADSNRLPRVRSYSGAEPEGLSCRVRDFHPLWSFIPERSATTSLAHSASLKTARSYNPARTSPGGLGYSPFARRYLGSRGCFPLLEVLRCFSSLRSLRVPMDSEHGHSGTPGSTLG